MADLKYIIKLVDGKTITLSRDSIELYPHIQDQLGDLAGNTLVLNYKDAEALYTILTTDFLEQEHSPDMYIRLIRAVEYLGNENMLDTMLKILLPWFYDPDILLKLKQDKDSFKKLMNKLSVPVLWQILQFFTVLEFEYQGGEFIGRGEVGATSDDLNYIVIEGPKNNKMEIWHKGQLVKELPQVLSGNKEGPSITNNGDIYYVDRAVYPNRIMKYVGEEIMANNDLAIIPQQLRSITTSKAYDFSQYEMQYATTLEISAIISLYHSVPSRDGTKFRMTTLIPTNNPLPIDIRKIERFEVRNMDTNDVILTRTTTTGNTIYWTSPRMNVIIETDTKLQYYLTTKNGTSLPINISSRLKLPDNINLKIYVQCNKLKPQRNYNYSHAEEKLLYLKLIFS